MTYPWGNLGKTGHVNRGQEWEALLDLIGTPPRARLRQTSTQSLLTGTFTSINWQTEDYDSANGHDTTTNISRYTCKVAGIYLLSGKIAWASNATGQRASQWIVNGSTIAGTQVAVPAVAAVERQYVVADLQWPLAVDDYVEIQGFQDTGGALSTSVLNSQIQSFMQVIWLCPS